MRSQLLAHQMNRYQTHLPRARVDGKRARWRPPPPPVGALVSATELARPSPFYPGLPVAVPIALATPVARFD
eukprot:2892846-Pleurochrysis_carterae.AAC.1